MAVSLARKQWIKRFDPWLPALALVIACGGMVAILSAKYPATSFVVKQFVGIVLGAGLFVFMARTDYRTVLASARSLYIANLALLGLVLLPLPGIADEAKGAQRWINLGPVNLQPSEIAKVVLILTLGAFLERHRSSIHKWPILIGSLVHIGIPMLLVFKQPDFGTSLVLAAVWFAMVFVTGARPAHLAAVAALGLALFAVGWKAGIIKDYQKNRLYVFLNPSVDPRGAGYHIQRSREAVGSGQVFGKGLFKGDMKRLQYVPERHTDFIFTVVAEETGFVGSTVLIGLYLLLILRMLLASARCEDPLGQIMAAGVAAVFTFHTIVNIGMTIGVMPVTGVPLPLFSYGPSAVVASWAALGLVESIALRRDKINF